MDSTEPRYGQAARLMHWIGAAVVLCMIPVGLLMVQDGLPRALQNALFIFHKNLGTIAIVLIAARLAWRLMTGAPRHDALPRWQARIAGATHAALYALLVVLPVSGYVRVRAGGFPIEGLDALGIGTLVPRSDALAETAKAIHYYGGVALMAVAALHIAAALHHVLIRQDGTWRRIWPPLGR